MAALLMALGFVSISLSELSTLASSKGSHQQNQVEGMDALLLDIVLTAKYVVDPPQAGGIAHDSVIVTNGDTLANH